MFYIIVFKINARALHWIVLFDYTPDNNFRNIWVEMRDSHHWQTASTLPKKRVNFGCKNYEKIELCWKNYRNSEQHCM
jgi:hypothetical protein